MTEKKGKFEVDDKIKAGAKKAGRDIKQAGADLKEDAKNLGHDIMDSTGHMKEDAMMVGHEMKEAAKDYKKDIKESYAKKRNKSNK